MIWIFTEGEGDGIESFLLYISSPLQIFRPSYGPELPYYILGHHFVTILWESSHGEKSAKQLAKEIATH